MISHMAQLEIPTFKKKVEEKVRVKPSERAGEAKRPPTDEEIEAFLQFEFARHDMDKLDEEGREQARGDIAQAVAEFVGLPPGFVKNLNRRLLIQRRVGAGGMGQVFAAEHLGMGETVALKVLIPKSGKYWDSKAQKRFHRELQIVARLDHPNIAKVYHAHESEEGGLYFGELVKGESLKQYLDLELADYDETPLRSVDDTLGVLEIMKQACRGVQAMHAQDVVHRDLKPDNIMIADQNSGGQKASRVKIIDLGLARDAEIAEEFETQAGSDEDTQIVKLEFSDPNVVVGTLRYMAPEQTRGEKASKASDVYSLGTTFYRVLTGAFTFRGSSNAELIKLIQKGRCRPLKELRADVPVALDNLIMRMLAVQPKNRPTIAQVLEMLEKIDRSA